MKTLILLILLVSCQKPLLQIDSIDESNTYFQRGKLSTISGFPVITVKGTPYQAGLQYGVLLRNTIHKLHNELDKQIDIKTDHSFFKKLIARISFWNKIRKIKKQMPQSFIDELRGIKDGSGMDQFQIDTIAFFPQIFFNISCTSLVVKNKNQLIHGRNLDWGGIGFLAPYAIVTRYEIDGQIPYLNFSYIGYPGLYTGINAKGLSISVNRNGSTPDRDDYNTDIPLPFKTREILSKSQNLIQVEDELRNYRSHAWFLTTTSALDNKAALFELVRGKLIISNMLTDSLAVTNISLSKTSRQKYSPINEHSCSNYSRSNKIDKLLTKNYKMLPIDRVFSILRDYSWGKLKHTPKVNYSINNNRTVQSIIFNNTNLESYFSFSQHHAAGKQFFHYDFSKDKISKSRKPLAFFSSADYRTIEKCYHQNCTGTLEDFIKKKDYKNALMVALAIEKNFPTYPNIYYPLAEIYMKLNKREKAVNALKKLLKMASISPYSRYKGLVQLAKIYKDENNKEKSFEIAQKAKELAMKYYFDNKRKNEIENLLGS